MRKYKKNPLRANNAIKNYESPFVGDTPMRFFPAQLKGRQFLHWSIT